MRTSRKYHSMLADKDNVLTLQMLSTYIIFVHGFKNLVARTRGTQTPGPFTSKRSALVLITYRRQAMKVKSVVKMEVK